MRVLVIGAGLIGLAIGWKAYRQGWGVTVVDPDPGSGAVKAAGGMLAPVSEIGYGEKPIHDIGLESLAAFPQFAGELLAATGKDIGLRSSGTTLVGFNDDDMAALDDLADLHSSYGVSGTRLTPSEVANHEPGISRRVRGGIHIPGDRHVDPVRMHAALLAAVSAQARVVRSRVTGIESGPGTHHTVLLENATNRTADVIVVAAGAHTPGLLGDDAPRVPVRPVSGVTLALRPRHGSDVPLTGTVRALVQGRSVYLIPTTDGRVIVGASASERGFDTAVTVTEINDLTRAALDVVPEVGDAELLGLRQGFRPGTPDNAPIVGYVRPGVLVATGHYRNGVLLTPWTADLVVKVLADPQHCHDFTVERFAKSVRIDQGVTV